METSETLPHWQLKSIFPTLSSPEFLEAKELVFEELTSLESYLSAHDIGSGEPLNVDSEQVKRLETLLTNINALGTRLSDMNAYLTGFISTNAFNEEAKAVASELRIRSSRYNFAIKRFSAWLGRFEVKAFLNKSPLASEHKYALEKASITAKHLMSEEAEEVASALDPSAGNAWSRLHGELISKGSTDLRLPGSSQESYTLSELKNLQRQPQRDVRRTAYEAELDLLAQYEVSYGAAMNSIKGQMNELALRRGWRSVLDESVFQNGITTKSLEALQQACRDSFSDFRRYLKAKATFLGQDTLAWFDLNAPVGTAEEKRFSWDEAKRFTTDTFATYSDELSAYAKTTFDGHWHDVPPRKGKRNGAFCMGVPGRKESRILLNFGYTLDDVFTLAHELGHGYHNHCKYTAERTLIQQSTPMTLAETASIFCETIVVNAMLEQASEREKLAILEQDLLGATALIVDIYSRFIFEKTVFDRRKTRELSTAEFRDIMLEAQAATYGSALDKRYRHSLMWAHKSHYYSTARSYYNFPYTFGYLFGLGLYATYQRQPSGFQVRYDKLLASTGLADAKTLASDFGIDIEDEAFWQGSLDIARERIDDYERLVAKQLVT